MIARTRASTGTRHTVISTHSTDSNVTVHAREANSARTIIADVIGVVDVYCIIITRTTVGTRAGRTATVAYVAFAMRTTEAVDARALVRRTTSRYHHLHTRGAILTRL